MVQHGFGTGLLIGKIGKRGEILVKFYTSKGVIIMLLLICFFISPVTIHASYPNSGQTPSGIPFSDMQVRIDALVAEYLGQTTPGVAIVVVKDGEIIFSRGYGYADIGGGISIDPTTTIFEYASTGKLFVWISAMQLVERGLLDLDVDINMYLPKDLSRQFAFEKPFTMRDLMNHAAGFGNNLLDSFYDAKTAESHLSLREALLLVQPRQIYEPGMVSAYSNFGTALAAYIVGHISGQGYAAFEMENIFTPIGMNSLNLPDWLGNDTFLQSKAKGYYSDGSGEFHSRLRGFEDGLSVFSPIYPAGSVNGTAEDLGQLIIALTPPPGDSGPLFISSYMLSTLFSPSSLDPKFPGTYHGFKQEDGIYPSFGHGGNNLAFSSSFVVVPEERFGLVVLTNAREAELHNSIRYMLLGRNLQPEQTVHSHLPSATKVEGRYMMMSRTEGSFMELIDYLFLPRSYVIAVDDNTIKATLGWGGTAIYQQVEPHVFRRTELLSPGISSSPIELRFRLEDGRPVQIHVGDGDDFSPPPRGMPSLIMSGVITVGSILFFLPMPIVILIGYLRRRKKLSIQRFDLFMNGFMFSGTLLVINNLVLMSRLGINNFRSVTEMAPHIWLNFAFTGLSILFFILPLLCWREEKVKRHSKALYLVNSSFMALLLLILQNWNFFVLI